jgi:hypothetical protein
MKMKTFILGIFLLLFGSVMAQNGGACIYILPGDSSVVCNIYGNAGVPSENNCHNTATSLGALPLNCPDFLNGCSAAYTTTGTSCFFIGSGSCNAATICANVALPVELIGFEGYKDGRTNVITWTTASEHNADYYTLIVYSEGMDQYDTYTMSAVGNTTNITNYRIVHHDPNESVNYYQLIQYDFDGQSADYGYISIDNSPNPRIEIDRVDLMGRKVDEYHAGFVIIIYDDYTTEKKYIYRK